MGIRSFLSSKAVRVLSIALVGVAFGGTIAYAAGVVAPDSQGTIHACYVKSGDSKGKVRIVSAGATCKSTENPLSWKSLTSYEELQGASCDVSGNPGTIQLAFDDHGVLTTTCLLNNPTCGDLVVSFGEECDDGNLVGGDGCSGTCQDDTTGESCVLDEECAAGEACTGGVCTIATTCGDGIPEGAEECDDGNLDSGDTCTSTCHAPSTESCNGIDDDNDGAADNGFNLGAACTNGIGQCSVQGNNQCDGEGGVECSAAPHEPQAEQCENNIDDDCDGGTDEDCPPT
jgi:cysteine-rich repeat protein